jgi:hypothetical protein
MRKGGGSFGMIVMVVVMAIVLYLVARAWSNMAPQALTVTNLSASPADLEADEGGSGESASPGHLPGIQEMQETTARHEEQVREAMEKTP